MPGSGAASSHSSVTPNSTKTASERQDTRLHYVEPFFALDLEWLLLDALARLQEPDGGSFYFRLSTKPIDQQPFARALASGGEDALRADVIAGGHRLREPAGSDTDRVILAACGALVPETLQAAELLAAQEGVGVTVLCLSSPDLLYHDWRRSRTEAVARGRPTGSCHLDRLLTPDERGLPIVTVIDGSSHALAWLGSALGTRSIPLGVDRFGQAGSQQSVYAAYNVDPEAIATAALVGLEG